MTAARGEPAPGVAACAVSGAGQGQPARPLAIALLQIAAAGYDQDENLRRGEAACRRAAALGADVALFPELWNTGYAFEDRDAARWLAQAVPRDGPFVRRFAALAAELAMAIAVTYLERGDDADRVGASGSPPGDTATSAASPVSPARPRNTVALFDRHGREALTYAKVHTCGFGEPESLLEPGEGFPVARLDTAAGPVAVGAMICFDREFPEAARVLALEGAELILVPNACELEANRLGQLRARAFENMTAVAVANYPAPAQNGRSVVYDPMAFDEAGASRDTCVLEAGSGEEVAVARLDLAALRAWRRREVWGGAWRRPAAYAPLVQPGGASR